MLRTPEFLSETVDARWMAVVRIAYGVVGMAFIGGALWLRNLLWSLDSPERMAGMLTLSVAWICLLLISLGFGGVIVRFVHFVILLRLRSLLPSVHLDFLLYQIIGFFLIFADANATWSLDRVVFRRNEQRSHVSAWPLFLLANVIGIWLFNAGTAKLLDPVWMSGEGVKCSLSQPWAFWTPARGILKMTGLMQIANWVVIVADVIWLPLFWLRKTRPVAVVLAFGFFSSLMFPLHINPVGEFGLVACLACVALLDIRESEERIGNVAKVVACLTLGLATLMMFEVYWPRVRHAVDGHLYPEAESPWGVEYSDGYEKTWGTFLSATWPMRTAMQVNRLTMHIWPTRLFCVANTFGRYGVRTVVELDDGTILEPTPIFHEDLTQARYLRWTRFAHGPILGCSRAAHRLALEPELPPEHVKWFHQLRDFVLAELSEDERSRVRHVEVLMRPILVIHDSADETELSPDFGWNVAYRYDSHGRSDEFTRLEPFPAPPFHSDEWRLVLSPH